MLVVVGALMMIFLPGAALVAGGLSTAFAGFTIVVTSIWLISTMAQVAVLRFLRGDTGSAKRAGWRLQLLAVAFVGVTIVVLFNRVANPFSGPLGLDSQEGWESVVTAWTVALVAVYLVWEREAQSRQADAARRLFDVQQAQLRLRRTLVEAQLRAMQARIDPRFFFTTLDAIETFYRREPARAEALFDELTTFLRIALPHLDSPSSTLGRELDLAAAAVRMHSLVSGLDHSLKTRVAIPLERLPFPAGVLLPLVRGALEAAAPAGSEAPPTRSLSVEADFDPATRDGLLRVQVQAAGPPSDAVRDSVRESLNRLFGDAAELSCRTDDAGRAVVEMVISHEP
ncbi:MAG: histidine kinase [Caldimonas sp.]